MWLRNIPSFLAAVEAPGRRQSHPGHCEDLDPVFPQRFPGRLSWFWPSLGPLTKQMPIQQIAVVPANSNSNIAGYSAVSVPVPDSLASVVVDSLASRSVSVISTTSSQEICRICHCESEEGNHLIAPCRCNGTLRYVHQKCLQQWIKSSDTKSCELCKFDFIMETKLKPFRKWEKLDMSGSERRKIICSVSFHIIAITCVVWSLYVLIDRTAQEVRQGNFDWTFWTKLVVVAIGFTGGVVFMYVQCKVYIHLWHRLKAYNRVIYVQNLPKPVPAAKSPPPSSVTPGINNNNSVNNPPPVSTTTAMAGENCVAAATTDAADVGPPLLEADAIPPPPPDYGTLLGCEDVNKQAQNSTVIVPVDNAGCHHTASIQCVEAQIEKVDQSPENIV